MDHHRQIPQALVLRWNSSKLRARCPYCLYSHGHGISEPPEDLAIDQTQPGWKLHEAGNRRRSDCMGGGQYLLVYPQTKSTIASVYGWEVDYETCEIVTVNREGEVAVPVNDGQDGRTLLPQHQKQNRLVEDGIDELIAATEASTIRDRAGRESAKSIPCPSHENMMKELYADPQFRQAQYRSHCILGEVRELELLCRQYPDDHLIVSVDEEGNTGALLAAIEERGSATLRWLHRHGGSIHQTNHYGRTPLMEAALWGRLETVQYLTQQRNVNVRQRDGNKMQATDLADDTPRNKNERMVRSGCVYREPSDADIRRKQIKALLDRLAPAFSKRPGAEPRHRTFFYRNTDGTLEIWEARTLLRPPNGSLQKAFATLDRGPSYPFVNAMSGYTQRDWPNVLNNAIWTKRAENLQALLGLPRDTYLASHVEPQLLAYILYRHSLHMLENEDHCRALASVMPASSLQCVITVSKPDLCGGCSSLFACFKQTFPDFNISFDCVGELSGIPRIVRDSGR